MKNKQSLCKQKRSLSLRDSNKIALESLAMDLKRASLFLNRKSDLAAKKFLNEALKRKSEIEISDLKSYIKKIILKIDRIKNPEDLLMYSTIIQNYTLTLQDTD